MMGIEVNPKKSRTKPDANDDSTIQYPNMEGLTKNQKKNLKKRIKRKIKKEKENNSSRNETLNTKPEIVVKEE